MTDHRAEIEQLLGMLTSLGGTKESADLRHSFEAKSWKLGDLDVQLLQQAISSHLSGGMGADGRGQDTPGSRSAYDVKVPGGHVGFEGRARKNDKQARTFEHQYEGLPVALSHLSPFVGTMDDRGPVSSVALLEQVNNLLGACSYAQFRQATIRLLVEGLRFDEIIPIDERPRLGGVQTFNRIERIAEYGELCVLVVEDTYRGPHSTSYNPLFQLHRWVVVFAIHPGLRRIRVVVRGTDRVCQYHTWVGRSHERHPGENLLTIGRRLALLRPGGQESVAHLESRWRKVLSWSTASLGQEWPSNGFVDDVPGVTWTGLVARELDSFLQKEKLGDGELHWGLEATLRNRFPIPISGGAAVLHLKSWELESAQAMSRWSLIARRQSRAVFICLQVRVVRSGVPDCEFSLKTELPIPDHFGELIIDGTPLQLCLAEVLPETPNEAETAQLVDEDPVEPEESFDKKVEDLPPNEPMTGLPRTDVAEDNETLLKREIGRTDDVGFFSLVRLYEFLIERRLALVAWCLWRTEVVPTNRQEFLVCTRRIRSRSRPFPLLSMTRLREFVRANRTLDLTPYPVVRRKDIGVPHWACTESWRSDDPDVWLPVAGARLHPAGHLALPHKTAEKGVFQLRVPEDGTEPLREHWRGLSDRRSWWLSEPLSFFSSSETGSVQLRPGDLTSPTTLKAVVLHHETLRVIISKSHRSKLRLERLHSYRVRDVPAALGEGDLVPPELLLDEGSVASRNAPWLRVPRRGWRTHIENQPPSILVQIRKKMQSPDDDPEAQFELCLGPDEFGVVTSSSIWPIIGPSGAVSGWRSAITLIAPPSQWVAGLSDGRTVKVEVLRDEDMPFDASGRPLSICVFDPTAQDQGSEPIFDGESGECIGEGRTEAILLGAVPRRLEPCPPDVWLRFRLLDGEGIPADGSAPQITDTYRSWLSVAYPDCALLCDQAELNVNCEVPAYRPRLRELAEDAGLVELERKPPEAPSFDPTVRRLRVSNAMLDTSPTGFFHFQCACGSATGASRAQLLCPVCSTRVRRHPRDWDGRGQSHVSLPEPFVHPWHMALAAAWAGLLEAELDQLLDEYSGNEYVQHLLSLPDPLERGTTRLKEGVLSRTDAERLRLALCSLRRELDLCPSREQLAVGFLVSSVTEPRSLQDFCGQPAGAATLEAPEFLTNLRQLHAAVDTADHLWASEATRPLARKIVAQALVAIFGSILEPKDWSDYRGAISRQLPPHRSGANRHVVPGMFRAGREIDEHPSLAYFGTSRLPEEVCGSVSPLLAVVCRDEMRVLPSMEWKGTRESTAHLLKHLAYHTLARDLLNPITALAMASDSLRWSEEGAFVISCVSGPPPDAVGQVFLSGLWQCLGESASDPSGLLRLLLEKRERELSPEWRDAEIQLVEEIEVWLPQQGARAKFVREVLARVLSGFSRSLGSHPELVEWTGERKRITSRFLPPYSSGLWRVIPGTELVLDPLAWVRANRQCIPKSILERQVLRCGDFPLSPPWPEKEPVQPASDAVPSSSREGAAEPHVELGKTLTSPAVTTQGSHSPASAAGRTLAEVRVYLGSIGDWMAQL